MWSGLWWETLMWRTVSYREKNDFSARSPETRSTTQQSPAFWDQLGMWWEMRNIWNMHYLIKTRLSLRWIIGYFQVTQECVDRIIRKDMRHPLTGQSLKEKDIIKLQRGATGFSAANDNLIAEKEGAAMSIGWVGVSCFENMRPGSCNGMYCVQSEK